MLSLQTVSNHMVYLISLTENTSGASTGMRFILTQTNMLQTHRAFRKTALTVLACVLTAHVTTLLWHAGG